MDIVTFRRTDLKDIEQKMIASRNASLQWRNTPISTRLNHMKALRKRIVAEMDEWTELLVKHGNKTASDALSGDLFSVLDALSYYEKHAEKILKKKKKKTPLHLFGGRSFVSYEPLGVVMVFAPWNFPLQLGLIPVISALISGNAVIMKGSEKLDPVNEKLETLLAEAGFPEGVFQVIYGSKEEAQYAIGQKPDKIFFTGSSSVGKAVLKQASQYVIPCDMELSGKDPMIVLEDANIERAARAAVWGAFMNSGQVCVSVERLYVHRSIYHSFLEKVIHFTKELKQGPEADLNQMATEQNWLTAREHLEDALEKGAEMHTGFLPSQGRSLHFPPVILTGITNEMKLMQEETFGPLLPIMTFETEEEAVKLANDSSYGLNASIFSRDLQRAERIAVQLDSGSCTINDVLRNISNMHLPFGGVKMSGFGRYHGKEGLQAFCNIKSTMIHKGRRNKEINWFPYRSDTAEWLKKGLIWKYK
ncbi:aldehyde dehydrogenase family protein [Bacillus salacetis]|uniref:Aldehyde dehydrogenase n=1 Tax=Bacillus salacetis TaxID=2315464 RepID=A0A3A1RC08_9BACI|nr:aldehyde dehydrogenase family protein [Bacillus salacetis]RIW38963.1 aldehyde dehydrogenase family protein [Bacillus salacetis]